eukprot:4828981-Pleurochrysis_carterae.AAC.1
MHWRELGRWGHGGKGVIHVLTTCLIETEGRRIAHGNERAKGGVIRGAEQLSLRGVSREVERIPIASDEVLEMRLPLGALQAPPKFVEVVKLEKERTVGEARAIVRRPAEAHRQATAELGEFQEILSCFEAAALEVGHDHELASPRGFGGEYAEVNQVQVCKLEIQQLGQFILVKRKGFAAIVGRRATIHLHDEKLSSVQLKVDAHRAQGAQHRVEANTVLHGKQGLEEKERTRAKSSGQDRKGINGQ